MKVVLLTILCIGLFAINVYAELSQSDLDKIRLIVKEEADIDKIRLIVKEEIQTAIHASEKRMKDYVDNKVETVNAKIEGMNGKFNILLVVVISLVGLIGVAIALPNYFTYKERKNNAHNNIPD